MTTTLVLIFLAFVYTQDEVESTIENVQQGNFENAQEILLKYQKINPNDPAALYLSALLETDGEKAKDKFLDVYKRHSSSKYGDDSVMKISEFYYANGSYIKAAEWLKRIPLFYSRSEYIDQSIKLFLNSLIVSGNKDTAIYYAKVFKKQFPQMDVDKKIMDLLAMNEQGSESSKDEGRVDVVGSIKDIFNKVKEEITSPIPRGQYSIQIGAYGNKKNAHKQRDLLIGAGHKARVDELSHRNLYAVRVGYYASKEDAKEDLNKVNSIIVTKAIILEVD